MVPLFYFPHPVPLFFLPVAGSPPTSHLITPAQPNPVFIEMSSKNYHPVRAAATPELSVKIFQNCQVFQFTMTVTTDQLTATCFLYNIEHSGTLM